MFEWLRRNEARFFDCVCICLLGTLMFLILAEIASRAIFSSSVLWSTDVVVFTLLWIIFLGAALSSRDREHITIQFVADLLPSRVHFLVLLFQQLCSIIFLIAASYSMYVLLDVLSTTWVPTIRLPQSYFTAPCLAFLVLFLLYETTHFFRLLITGRRH